MAWVIRLLGENTEKYSTGPVTGANIHAILIAILLIRGSYWLKVVTKIHDTNDGGRVLDAFAHLLSRALVNQSASVYQRCSCWYGTRTKIDLLCRRFGGPARGVLPDYMAQELKRQDSREANPGYLKKKYQERSDPSCFWTHCIKLLTHKSYGTRNQAIYSPFLERHQNTAIRSHFTISPPSENSTASSWSAGNPAHRCVNKHHGDGWGGGTFSFPLPTGNSNKEVLGSVYMSHSTPLTSGQKSCESEAELHIKLFIQMFTKAGDWVSCHQKSHVPRIFLEFIHWAYWISEQC